MYKLDQKINPAVFSDILKEKYEIREWKDTTKLTSA